MRLFFAFDLAPCLSLTMETFDSPLDDGSLNLSRYPDVDKNLLAWDAADHYLLAEFSRFYEALSAKPESLVVWVLGDNFGALSVALSTWAEKESVAVKIICYTDSYLSLRAIKQNLEVNADNSRSSQTEFIHDPEKFAEQSEASIVLGRVPKAKSQLAYLLSCIRPLLAQDCPLLIGGMDKHLSKGQFDLIERYYGKASFLPARKKARVWQGLADQSNNNLAPASTSYALDSGNLLITKPNAFSYAKLDLGARFFLENIALLPKRERVIDLACGNGVLGLQYVVGHNPENIRFCDESFQAIAATRENWKAWNQDGDLDQTRPEFFVDHGLKQQVDASAELVLLNPPFHLQNSIARTIANELFIDAMRCLIQGGELWVVANRHLGYHVLLKQLFGNCKLAASNKKFVLLKAFRR